MFQQEIAKEEINELPLRAFEGEIIIIDKYKDVEKVIPDMLKHKILGFDTETKPWFRKGNSNTNKVALLQFSSEKTAWLFRLNSIGFHPLFSTVLENPEILKIGVAINDDLKHLKALHNFNENGFIDLQKYVKEFDIISMGLKKLTAIVLGFRISKSQQLSNWEIKLLTNAQARYAATDAWTCLEIYKKLYKNRK